LAHNSPQHNKLIEDAVEVYGDYAVKANWWRVGDKKDYTHKAYLIGIEPIKKETAEDVLRAIMSQWRYGIYNEKLLDRAKAVLDEAD